MTQTKEVMSALVPESFRHQLEDCAHFGTAYLLEMSPRGDKKEANSHLVTYKVFEGL